MNALVNSSMAVTDNATAGGNEPEKQLIARFK